MNKVFAFTVGHHQPATLESLLVPIILNVQVFRLTNSHKYQRWKISTVIRIFSGRQLYRSVKALRRITDWLCPHLQSLKSWRIFAPWRNCLPEKTSLNSVAAKASRLKSALSSLFGRLHVWFPKPTVLTAVLHRIPPHPPTHPSLHLDRSVTALFHNVSFTQNHAVCLL